MENEFRDIKTLIDAIAAPNVSSNGVGYERARAELTAKLSVDTCKMLNELNESIKESSKSSESLGQKLVYLNRVLATATAVGAIATVVMAFKS